MTPLTMLALSIELDPHVNPFTSFWTSVHAAQVFWSAFAAVALAVIVVQMLRSHRDEHISMKRH